MMIEKFDSENSVENAGEVSVKALTKRFTATYLLALTVIAALSLAAYATLRSVSAIQEQGLRIANEISRQRLLSQQISLLAMRLVTEQDPIKRQEIRKSFRDSIAEMRIVHKTLTAHSSEWQLMTSYSEEDKDAYLNPPLELERRVNAYLASASRLVMTPHAGLSLRNSELEFLVTVGSDSLLQSLDYAVNRYQLVAKDRIDFVNALELTLLLGIFAILILEAFFIFRPMAGRITDATSEINRSAREIAAIIETVGEGIISFDANGQIISVNREVERLWGTTKNTLVLQSLEDLFLPSENVAIPSILTVPDGQWVEFSASTEAGVMIPVEVHCNHIEIDGKGIGVIAIRDLRQRKQDELAIKRSLEEKKVLLQEIHHRVKNNLQIISSFLSLQSRNLKDEKLKSLFQESRNRVDTMSLIHEELYKSEDLSTIDFGSYISDLTTNLFRTFGVNRAHISLSINAKGALFNIDTAVPCGLIINELVANALEHAFTDGQGGVITIDLTNTDHDHTWLLRISDTGNGMDPSIDISKAKSMGLRLVNALVSQLRGALKISRDGGTSFEIIFTESGASVEQSQETAYEQRA